MSRIVGGPTRDERSRKSLRGVCLGVGLLVIQFALSLSGAAAQTPVPPAGGWTEPELVYETSDEIDQPSVIADDFGGTHIIWRQTGREAAGDSDPLESIYYLTNRDGQWTTGSDVVAMAVAAGTSAAVDPAGLIHAIWVGPSRTLYHSSVPVWAAASAQEWSEPQVIDLANLHTHIVAGDDGVIHVVYPGLESDGIFYTRYDAVQGVWSTPVNVSPTSSLRASSDYARLAIGADQSLHVVWSEFRLPDGWPPTGVYYAQSIDGGATWTEPQEMAGEGFDQINIAAAGDQIHTAWNGMVGLGGRFHSWSGDGGRSWSAPAAVVPSGRGGTEGPPQLVIDNLGVVHLLTTFDGCAWYAAWSGESWSPLSCISGPRAMASGYIEEPALALANGNRLHAVFWDDRARLWHTTMTTGAPPTHETLPPAPQPTPVVDAGVPAAVPEPTAEATATRPAWTNEQPVSSAAGPARPLLMAVASIAAVIGLVALVRLVKSR